MSAHESMEQAESAKEATLAIDGQTLKFTN